MNSFVTPFFAHNKTIPAAAIIQSPEVRALCKQNTCGYYKTNWTCPPAVADLEELREHLGRFDNFIVFYEIYQVESSFDWNGMMEAARLFKDKTQELKTRLDGIDKKALILGMGSCNLCPTCTDPTGEPCHRPADAIFSLEVYGIDVMRLMKENDMKYYNSKNTITLVGGLLYNA